MNRVVLPGYDKYRSIMSNETRVYVSPPPEKKIVTIDVIPVVVKEAALTNDLVRIPLDITDLHIDDAADLEASSDPEDE